MKALFILVSISILLITYSNAQLVCLNYRIPESMVLAKNLTVEKKCSRKVHHCVKMRIVEGENIRNSIEGRCAYTGECEKSGCVTIDDKTVVGTRSQITKCCSDTPMSNSSAFYSFCSLLVFVILAYFALH